MDIIFSDLLKFIEKFHEKTFNSSILFDVNYDTDIENDLKITGDDADQFLQEFVLKYNIDYSNFNGGKYFGFDGEENDFVFRTLRFFIGQKKWMPLPKHSRQRLTIKMLIEAIQNGIIE
jgi:hypothetical protein